MIQKKLAVSETKLIWGAVPYRANEPMISVADITKLKKMGWMPLYSIEEGIDDMMKYLENEKEITDKI